MKIEHIHKLILKFIGGGIVNYPTRFLKWIKVESCDCDGGDDSGDDGGDDGGDSQDTMSLEDFSNFYISLLDDNYAETYNEGDTLQLSDLFETPNINILKSLLTLGTLNDTNSENTLNFTENKNDPNTDGSYGHTITIYPNGGESGNISLSTTHIYLDDGVTKNENYNINFSYNSVDDTLTVLNVSPNEG